MTAQNRQLATKQSSLASANVELGDALANLVPHCSGESDTRAVDVTCATKLTLIQDSCDSRNGSLSRLEFIGHALRPTLCEMLGRTDFEHSCEGLSPLNFSVLP